LDFSKKNIWIVTDGSQGMLSQVKGLAQQLSNKIFDIKIELIFPWSMLQPGFLPAYRWIFKNKIDFNNKPNIVISCGRKSIYFSLYLKKLFMKKIITIHIQNPKIDLSKFDFIISPNHDKIDGSNVIKSVGAIHQFTKKMIESKKDSYTFIPKDNLISFIIGGNNRHYKFTKKSILDLTNKIKNLKKKYSKFYFLIISSRRTNLDMIKFMKEKLDKIAYIWNGVDKNPYSFALNNSKFFVVTSDSTSMISECAFTGKPVFVFHLPFKRISKRIESFHHEFENLNITKKFSDHIDLNPWQYETLDEAKRISGIIKERIIKGFNEFK
jgi:hypothetical protein